MLSLGLSLETIVTVGISTDFISYWLSSALWLNESEGHASISIESYVYQRVILIHVIFKGTVLIMKISFVQAENTATVPACIAVVFYSTLQAAFGDLMKLHVESTNQSTDLLITALTSAIWSPSLCPCSHWANEIYVGQLRLLQERQFCSPHLCNHLTFHPSFTLHCASR